MMHNVNRWLSGQWGNGKVSDLRLNGHGFNSRSERYQAVTNWMGDCLRTGKLSRYKTNTNVNSAFHPPGVGKLSTDLSGWG